MRNITLEVAGADRRSTSAVGGQMVSVTLNSGAIAEVSPDLINWTTLATVSGDYIAPTVGLGKVSLRFNLPVYSGIPIEVSVE